MATLYSDKASKGGSQYLGLNENVSLLRHSYAFLSYWYSIIGVTARCWVRVASWTWSVLWLWNTNKESPQTQVRKTTWKIVNIIIEQQRQRRSIRKSRL